MEEMVRPSRKPRAEWIAVGSILLFYFALYFPSVFARVEASEFMSIDPQSIMDSLEGLTSYPYYNMNKQYHSQFYGWTYFSLNFFVLMLGKLFGLSSEYATNLIVTSVLFLIGAALVWHIYTIGRIFFSTFWSVFATLAVVVNPIAAHFFVEIHPESLGLLFQLVAIKLFINIYRADDFPRRTFYRAVVFLSLSSFCKQSFFVANVFIYIGFFIVFTRCTRVGRSVMGWKLFREVTWRAMGFFFLVLFLIHPFAIIHLDRFIEIQIVLRGDHATRAFAESAALWAVQVKGHLVILMNFLLLVVIPFLRKDLLPYKLSLGFTCLVSVIFMSNATNFITARYLYPILLFFFFNIFYFLVHILIAQLRSRASNGVANTTSLIIGTVFSVGIFTNATYALYHTHSRYILDGLNTQRVTWNVLRELPLETRIAFSPNIAVLEPFKSKACSAWQGCGGFSELEAYDPDYLVFSPDYLYFNSIDFSIFGIGRSCDVPRISFASGWVIAHHPWCANRSHIFFTVCFRPATSRG